MEENDFQILKRKMIQLILYTMEKNTILQKQIIMKVSMNII